MIFNRQALLYSRHEHITRIRSSLSGVVGLVLSFSLLTLPSPFYKSPAPGKLSRFLALCIPISVDPPPPNAEYSHLTVYLKCPFFPRSQPHLCFFFLKKDAAPLIRRTLSSSLIFPLFCSSVLSSQVFTILHEPSVA